MEQEQGYQFMQKEASESLLTEGKNVAFLDVFPGFCLPVVRLRALADVKDD